jgi:glycosyltransferase involved in cell wall biosynthesis
MNKKKILCFIDYYLPGYKFGGPIRSIEGFVENFGNKYNIDIITLDRDFLEKKPYNNIHLNKWNKVGKARVFYLPKKFFNFFTILKIVIQNSYDLIYLNSFFSLRFTLLPLILRKVCLFKKNINFIIAPRGMLSKENLKIKYFKKYLYIKLTSLFNLYINLKWQATCKSEKRDIFKILKFPKKDIFIAPNLTAIKLKKSREIKVNKKKPLKLIFVSRISPAKNLDFLLKVLSKVEDNASLTVYGNFENNDYYNKCLALKNQMPKNIIVNFKKGVKNKLITKTLSKYDLFVFPTKGENFGHVILESLASAVPVLTSNRVFWSQDKYGGLMRLPLNKAIWRSKILEWTKLNQKTLTYKKIAALKYANNYFKNKIPLQHNNILFKSALKDN